MNYIISLRIGAKIKTPIMITLCQNESLSVCVNIEVELNDPTK